MYCVVYEFQVIPGENLRFEKAWSEFTEAIFRVRGSLGSRLHKTIAPDVYVAYAQWPSKEIFQSQVLDSAFTEKEKAARAAMQSTLLRSEQKYHLEAVADHLRTASPARE